MRPFCFCFLFLLLTRFAAQVCGEYAASSRRMALWLMALRVARSTSARLDFVACDVINWWVIPGEGCRSLAMAESRGGWRRMPAWATGWWGAGALGGNVTHWLAERMNEWVSDVCYSTDFRLMSVLIMSRTVCKCRVRVFVYVFVYVFVSVEKSSSRSRRQLDQSRQSARKTSECNFESIVVAVQQQHAP